MKNTIIDCSVMNNGLSIVFENDEKYDYIDSIYGCMYFDDLDFVLKLLSDTDECVRIEMIEACYACKQESIEHRIFVSPLHMFWN